MHDFFTMITFLDSTDSTNTYLWQMLKHNPDLPDGTTVCANYQTAGRGQTGNSWESVAGQNLLFSTLIKTECVPIERQFVLNELVAIGVTRVVKRYIPEACIKWPNDIYYQNSKLAGILIEGQIIGKQLTIIAGVGLNVNQTQFFSNALNPISLKQITNIDYDIKQLLNDILSEIDTLKPLLTCPQQLKDEYMQLLYRKDGYHLYKEVISTVAPMMPEQYADESAFLAKIADISPQGALILEKENGEQKTYNFKQIKYIITPI